MGVRAIPGAICVTKGTETGKDPGTTTELIGLPG